jgi:hypothetical protein
MLSCETFPLSWCHRGARHHPITAHVPRWAANSSPSKRRQSVCHVDAQGVEGQAEGVGILVRLEGARHQCACETRRILL